MKRNKIKQTKLNILPLDGTLKEYFNTNERIYINSTKQNKGQHIFDSMKVYFESTVQDRIKQSTQEGIEELIKATNLQGLLNVDYKEFSDKQLNNFLKELNLSKTNQGIILINKLSGYGHQNREYQLLIGDFNLDGLNGSYVGSAAIIRNLRDNRLHKFLVAHELGHIFKAANNKERKNIKNNLGMHCFDNKIKYVNNTKIINKTPCVMRQDFSLEHQNTLSKIGAIYCPDCINDMKKYIKG